MRLYSDKQLHKQSFGNQFEEIFNIRKQEADIFYNNIISNSLTKEEQNISRQAFAGLLWSKQFYHFIIDNWLEGDPNTVNYLKLLLLIINNI
jgi:hypothetical protein